MPYLELNLESKVLRAVSSWIKSQAESNETGKLDNSEFWNREIRHHNEKKYNPACHLAKEAIPCVKSRPSIWHLHLCAKHLQCIWTVSARKSQYISLAVSMIANSMWGKKVLPDDWTKLLASKSLQSLVFREQYKRQHLHVIMELSSSKMLLPFPMTTF